MLHASKENSDTEGNNLWLVMRGKEPFCVHRQHSHAACLAKMKAQESNSQKDAATAPPRCLRGTATSPKPEGSQLQES